MWFKTNVYDLFTYFIVTIDFLKVNFLRKKGKTIKN